jgi:hypothetical protein
VEPMAGVDVPDVLLSLAAWRFLPSSAVDVPTVAGGSAIGQINPVRGVNLGLWSRRISSDRWRELTAVYYEPLVS